jgi:RNA polymerase sigma factor (sigma-70 family)
MDADFSTLSDREIADSLFEQFGERLYYYATKAWQLDEDEVWDVLYDSLYGFIKSYSDRKFASKTDVERLLWKIFKNRLRDKYRQKKRIETQYREVPYEEALPGDAERFSDPLWSCNAEHETVEGSADSPVLLRLEAILDGLKDWERQLLLCRANHIPYADIAAMTGMKAESLKVYYQRLKNRISNEMNECFAPMEKRQ